MFGKMATPLHDLIISAIVAASDCSPIFPSSTAAMSMCFRCSGSSDNQMCSLFLPISLRNLMIYEFR